MNCQYLQNGCVLGYHGGKPLPGNCRACIAGEENNPESAKAFFDAMENAHPSSAAPISGCCDDARNYDKE